MKKIAINTTLNYIRNKNKIQNVEEFPIDLISNFDAEIENNYTLPDIEPEQLFAVIAELPTGYRTVLNLFVFENYSHKEIAAQLKEALSRFSVHPSEKQQSLFLETASKLAISKKRKRFFFITSGFLIGLAIITFFAINTKLPSNLKNTITKSEKSSVKVNVKTPHGKVQWVFITDLS